MLRLIAAFEPTMPILALAFALLGITLGSPAGDLRVKLGDPLLVERLTDLSRIADYLRDDDPSAVLRVTEQIGRVYAVEIERERPEATAGIGDRYGITLGMSRTALEAKRGKPAFETMNTLLYPEDSAQSASIIYRLDGDIIESIKLVGSGSTVAGKAALPALAEAAGDGYGSAILDLSTSVLVSDHFRDRYLTVHGCAAAGRSSTTDRRAGQTFAIASADCNGTKRTFYFDITRARSTLPGRG